MNSDLDNFWLSRKYN